MTLRKCKYDENNERWRWKWGNVKMRRMRKRDYEMDEIWLRWGEWGNVTVKWMMHDFNENLEIWLIWMVMASFCLPCLSRSRWETPGEQSASAHPIQQELPENRKQTVRVFMAISMTAWIFLCWIYSNKSTTIQYHIQHNHEETVCCWRLLWFLPCACLWPEVLMLCGTWQEDWLDSWRWLCLVWPEQHQTSSCSAESVQKEHKLYIKLHKLYLKLHTKLADLIIWYVCNSALPQLHAP